MKLSLKEIFTELTGKTGRPEDDKRPGKSQFPNDKVTGNLTPQDAERLLDQYSEKLQQKGIKISSYRKIGSGVMGTAFDLGNRVLKITSDKTEAVAAKHLVGKNLPHVYRVIAVFELDSTGVFAIYQEKLSPLPFDDNVKNVISFPYWENIEKAATGQIKDIRPELELYFSASDKQYVDITLRLINDVAAGVKELKSASIQWNDWHLGNILWDPNKKVYKIIDIGVSRSPQTPIDKID